MNRNRTVWKIQIPSNVGGNRQVKLESQGNKLSYPGRASFTKTTEAKGIYMKAFLFWCWYYMKAANMNCW